MSIHIRYNRMLIASVRFLKKTVAVFLLVFVLNVPAYAFETTRASAFVTDDTKVEEYASSLSKTPSSAVVDPCLSLLKKVRHTDPPSTTDRNQRTAGQAVTLSFVLGLRMALGPKQVVKKKDRVRFNPQILGTLSGSGSHALAVADYRRCKNEHALKNLESDWRWTR